MTAASAPPGQVGETSSPVFHDLRSNPVSDFVGLIDPDRPEIVQLAKRLGNPEEA